MVDHQRSHQRSRASHNNALVLGASHAGTDDSAGLDRPQGKSGETGGKATPDHTDHPAGHRGGPEPQGRFHILWVGTGYEDTVVIIRSDGPVWSLGFYRGRELPDPNGLLKGNGRLHAAAIIAGRADVESEALRELLLAANEAALQRKRARSTTVC